MSANSKVTIVIDPITGQQLMHIIDAASPAEHHRNNPEYKHIDVPIAIYNKFASDDELQAHLAPRIAALIAVHGNNLK